MTKNGQITYFYRLELHIFVGSWVI